MSGTKQYFKIESQEKSDEKNINIVTCRIYDLYYRYPRCFIGDPQ